MSGDRTSPPDGRGRSDRAGPRSATRRAVHRPTRLGGTLSVGAGLVSVGLVASAGPQLRALGIEAVGLLVLALGIELRHRDRRVVGGLVALGGAGIVAAAVGAGFSAVPSLSDRVELIPGMIGLVPLVAGVSGLRAGWGHHLVTGGTALLLASAAGSGVVLRTGRAGLLAAVVAAVVAWDLGGRSINLGEQVGRQARTRSVELVHGLGTVAVGAVAAVAAVAVAGNGVSGLPLAGLAALLVAGVVLLLALYN